MKQIDPLDDNKFGAVFMPKTTETSWSEALPVLIVIAVILIGLFFTILYNVEC